MTSGASVRAAIIGLGRWGRNLVAANAANPASALRFTHAATGTPNKARPFCREYGLQLLPDLDEVLGSDRVDAVVLATPHSQHGAQICRAARAGKHVLVEKPLTLNLAEAEAAVAAAQAADVKLCVGFNRRFMPAFQQLEASVDVGALGRILHFEGAFSGSFGYGYTDQMWRGDMHENPAGGMAAMGIHVLDAMIALLGPVRRVSTVSRRIVAPAQLRDVTSVMLDFHCGATGSLSTLMTTGSFWRLHVFGSEGWVQMPDQSSLITCDLAGTQERRNFDPCDGLARELDAFGGNILAKQSYPVTHHQALSGVAAMQAIAISAEHNAEWTEVESPATSLVCPMA
ncbi:Gfo/Idh/MocA family oxidoreductase [Paracoccus onubensis]|uniref:Gfo/Idh/MocA family protein n=1 Tax=Paracoccus onubensis TaxID=1675788 RepID=UPI002730BA1A|nr:Gfo/Idh/MocA family oxidoreductase [Paracoccus onubensis]MDP0926715.1 Gfo/Idh/MocA family oxidoreductase [Paracoccus onubensis]